MFKHQRGLRQGDPLSPFIFNLAVEPLNLLIHKAISLELWCGVEICRNGTKVSHLQYADDTIIFCDPDILSLLNVKRMLIIYELASGLQINFHKSSLFGINVKESWLEEAANSLQCKVGTLPFSYLGPPIGSNVSRIKVWEPIVDRMTKKLASWKGTLLSLGGRATLIKASLSCIPMYYMSIYPMPSGVRDLISRIQRNFLWNGHSEKNRLSPAAWHLIELPKSLGGLGLGNIHQKNLALLAKWVWRYLSEPHPLWRKLVQEKYHHGPLFSILDLESPKNGGPWRAICSALLSNPQAKALLMAKIKKKIGNGRDSFFWHDCWLGDQPLKIGLFAQKGLNYYPFTLISPTF